jgi:ferric-dicitrate binding protein FerR (iron transport regulator)
MRGVNMEVALQYQAAPRSPASTRRAGRHYHRRVRSLLAVLAAALLLAELAPVPAAAGDAEGKIQLVDSAERTVVLEDGTKVWIPDAIMDAAIKAGAEVKIVYEERDGKYVATSVRVK